VTPKDVGGNPSGSQVTILVQIGSGPSPFTLTVNYFPFDPQTNNVSGPPTTYQTIDGTTNASGSWSTSMTVQSIPAGQLLDGDVLQVTSPDGVVLCQGTFVAKPSSL
jgi:hypothetical protein